MRSKMNLIAQAIRAAPTQFLHWQNSRYLLSNVLSDFFSKARGTCPKCLMDLVAEPRRAMTDNGVKENAGRDGGGVK